MTAAATLSPPEPLKLQVKDGKIYSLVRKKWLVQTPETMRRQYLLTLMNEYGYPLNQIKAEESPIGERNSAGGRFDFAICRSAQDIAESKTPLIIIEELSTEQVPTLLVVKKH